MLFLSSMKMDKISATVIAVHSTRCEEGKIYFRIFINPLWNKPTKKKMIDWLWRLFFSQFAMDLESIVSQLIRSLIWSLTFFSDKGSNTKTTHSAITTCLDFKYLFFCPLFSFSCSGMSAQFLCTGTQMLCAEIAILVKNVCNECNSIPCRRGKKREEIKLRITHIIGTVNNWKWNEGRTKCKGMYTYGHCTFLYVFYVCYIHYTVYLCRKMTDRHCSCLAC